MVEMVSAGYNPLVNTDKLKILSILNNSPIPFSAQKLYGSGEACKNIVTILENLYK